MKLLGKFQRPVSTSSSNRTSRCYNSAWNFPGTVVLLGIRTGRSRHWALNNRGIQKWQKTLGIRTGNFRGLAWYYLGIRYWRKKRGIRTRSFRRSVEDCPDKKRGKKIQGIGTSNFRGLAGDCLGSRSWRKKLGIRTHKFGSSARNFLAGR
jgi:hypothetical protein